MGELMDQIASGGPPLIPLAEIPGAQALQESIRQEPERWKFRLRVYDLREALREAVCRHPAVDGNTLRRLSELEIMLVTWRNTDDRPMQPEDVARKLLVWCGYGPALFPLPPHLRAAFVAYVRKSAAWERSLPPDKTWWQGGPWQVLDSLLDSLPT